MSNNQEESFSDQGEGSGEFSAIGSGGEEEGSFSGEDGEGPFSGEEGEVRAPRVFVFVRQVDVYLPTIPCTRDLARVSRAPATSIADIALCCGPFPARTVLRLWLALRGLRLRLQL